MISFMIQINVFQIQYFNGNFTPEEVIADVQELFQCLIHDNR